MSESMMENAERAETRARAVAELVLGSELLPGPVPLPDFSALMAQRTRWRRVGLALSSVGALGAATLVAALFLREGAPVSYVVDGTVAIAEGVIDAEGAPGSAPAAVRFSEGTEIGLSPGARLRVVDRTVAGASLALDRGRARFAVTHREGARWSVATGPFTVEVIGTKFALDWSPREERLVVELTSGSVQVRGASVGGPVAMHAGERLIATAGDRRVTLSPLAEPIPPAVERVRSAAPSVVEPVAIAAPPRAPAAQPAAAPPTYVRPSRRAVRRARVALAAPTRTAVPATSAPLPVAPLPLAPSAPAPEERRAPVPIAPAPAPAPTLAPVPVAPAAQPTAALAPPSTLFAGGSACREGAQYRFERHESGIALPDFYTLAFSNPRPDRTRSWCGQASLRVDATFNEVGKRNFFGRFAKETGEVVLKLHRRTNFTGRTVTAHVYVDGPADARFTAELVVVNQGRWVSGPPSRLLTPGHWWTISHRFEAENVAGGPGSSNPGPFPVGGTSPVSDVDRLGIAIHSTGGRRVWSGAVYVDDVSWK